MFLVEPTLIVAILLGSCLVTPSSDRFQRCLPDGTELTDVVSVTIAKPGVELTPKKTTVKEKLIAIKARCQKGKLVDESGREIRFFRLQGSGVIRRKATRKFSSSRTKELEKLRKRYTVIEMTCNPEGVQIQ